MQPNDIESAMEELRRLKKENTGLIEERLLLKVAAEKYEKRAIYVRKKYQQLKEKHNLGSDATSTANQDNLRLKTSQLKSKLKGKEAELALKDAELQKLKIKIS